MRTRAGAMVAHLQQWASMKGSDVVLAQAVNTSGANKFRRIRGQNRRLDRIEDIRLKMEWDIDEVTLQARMRATGASSVPVVCLRVFCLPVLAVICTRLYFCLLVCPVLILVLCLPLSHSLSPHTHTHTGVLATKDWNKWDFRLMGELLEGPLTNPSRIDLALSTKFFKRILSFARPDSNQLFTLPWSARNLRYVQVRLRAANVGGGTAAFCCSSVISLRVCVCFCCVSDTHAL